MEEDVSKEKGEILLLLPLLFIIVILLFFECVYAYYMLLVKFEKNIVGDLIIHKELKIRT